MLLKVLKHIPVRVIHVNSITIMQDVHRLDNTSKST